jgi:hypothetical protein
MTPPDGDICRYCDEAEGFIAASLVDWRAFFLVRDLARWRDLDAQEDAKDGHHRHHDVNYWFPLGNSWDALETRLYARWQSVTRRWWEDLTRPPRYTCLVCRDTGRIRTGNCPGCRPTQKPPPLKKPRKRDWVALDQPQLFG